MWFHCIWIIIYCLNLTAIIVVSRTIIQYLQNKPLGLQTLQDLLVVDLLRVQTILSSAITFVVVISGLHVMFPAVFLPPNLTWIRICTLTYYFFYLLLCANHTVTCILRIISLVFVGFMVQPQ